MSETAQSATAGQKAVVLDYQPVSQERLAAVRELKLKAAAYFDALEAAEATFGRSRDISLAKTKIQEASMWATRGLTNPE